MNNKYLGIDVGGTGIKYATIDDNSKIIESGSVDTPYEKIDFVLALKAIIEQYPDVTGIGISMPGFIDSDTGYMETAGALGNLYEENLVELLQAQGVTKPIHVENDAKCAAISEMACGNATDVRTFACITIGTGVGGGIVVDGNVLKGKNFVAGELGIMRNDINSDRTISEVGAIMPSRIAYANKYNMDVKDVDGRLALSDEEIKDEFYANITRLIYNLTFVLNPEKILMGGAISNDDSFIERLRTDISKTGMHPSIEVNIDRCLNTNNAGLIGAVYELKKVI